MLDWVDSKLNTEQINAIKTDESVFLIACPGSGKTRTITYKIAHELSKIKSSKHFVVAITYTNRAAEEINERIENLGIDTSQLWIGTIHSFCLEWILRPYSIYHEDLREGFQVINNHDSEKIITELCNEHNETCQAQKNQTLTYWDCSFYFSQLDEIVYTSYKAAKQDTIPEIIKKYFEILRANRQIDFELILHYAHVLLVKYPTISLLLSKIFPLILVDEYQDTKNIQYLIVASILKAGKGSTKAFIAGDPNQAIFESLGGFPIDMSELKQIAEIEFVELVLPQNYRSSERIVEYFSAFNAHSTKIEASSEEKLYPSLISFNHVVIKSRLEDELIRLIRFNIETMNIAPKEICILGPQWLPLASMSRKLVTKLPEYNFDGPGMVPFARDIENFWYKLSRIALTSASPRMYVKRLRWAGEILRDMEVAGIATSTITRKSLLRECNSFTSDEQDGLQFLTAFYNFLFCRLQIDFQVIPFLRDHYKAFFESSEARIAKLKNEGTESISDISTFRRVFENRSGIAISTIHGVKGDEYDTVIAFGLLEGMVPHFNAFNSRQSAMKLLYVICSRARKNLHLISERQRFKGRNDYEYEVTRVLASHSFNYDDIPST